MRSIGRAIFLLFASGTAISVDVDLQAQLAPSARFLDVGSERERLLRALQATGDVALYPWSIREFSPAEWDWLTPRTSRGLALLPPESRVHRTGRLDFAWLPVETNVIANTGFPYGFNDGPVWAGRGITGAVSGGFAGRMGPLSFQVEPIVFGTSNTAFALAPNGDSVNPFLNALYPRSIDLPQRFGNGAYGRVDLGRTALRLDIVGVAIEASNADQWWGPVIQSPIILGNNAGGFPHLMIGSSHPVGIWIGTVHARVVYGRLTESAYAPTNAVTPDRFMSGLVGVFTPRGAPGLELGAARFFHDAWPNGGFFHGPFGRPFEGILKNSQATTDNPTGTADDNQLASVFVRWVLPPAGVDLYAEYGREDHNQDLRDFWQEPDHDAGYVLGLQKAWALRTGALIVARGELLNTRISHLQQGRGQSPWYIHSRMTQGHTLNGQALGAAGAFGGGASTLAADYVTARGRWTVEWDRLMRAERRGLDGLPAAGEADVIHAFGIERAFNFRESSLVGGARGLLNLNRDHQDNRFSLNLSIAARRVF